MNLLARLKRLLKRLQVVSHVPPAEAGSAKNKGLIGTTEVVSCYKAFGSRLYQQPVRPRPSKAA
ncbi:MAG: hypothetical protein WAL85_16225 [Candidatus Korobacteraceae bacterium]